MIFGEKLLILVHVLIWSVYIWLWVLFSEPSSVEPLENDHEIIKKSEKARKLVTGTYTKLYSPSNCLRHVNYFETKVFYWPALIRAQSVASAHLWAQRPIFYSRDSLTNAIPKRDWAFSPSQCLRCPSRFCSLLLPGRGFVFVGCQKSNLT